MGSISCFFLQRLVISPIASGIADGCVRGRFAG